MSEGTNSRRLRFVRDPVAYPGFTPDEHDARIVMLVHQYRFLDVALLEALLTPTEPDDIARRSGKDGKQRPVRYGFGRKALDRRLQKLFHTSFLGRDPNMDRPLSESFGSPPAVYSIDKAAIKLVSDQTGIPAERVKRIIAGNRNIKNRFLSHALEVSKFHAVLQLACMRSKGRFRLVFWHQGRPTQDHVTGIDDSGNEVDFPVYPDAFFGLSVADKGVASYFLEIDRGTMPIAAKGQRSDLRKKFLGYYHYRISGRFSQRYLYTKSLDGQVVGLKINQEGANQSSLTKGELSPIRGFRALFLIPGSMDVSGNAGGRIQNAIKYLAELEQVRESLWLFWFAPLDAFSLERPESVFAKTWIRPNLHQDFASLIE